MNYRDDEPEDHVPMSRLWVQNRLPVHEQRTEQELGSCAMSLREGRAVVWQRVDYPERRSA